MFFSLNVEQIFLDIRLKNVLQDVIFKKIYSGFTELKKLILKNVPSGARNALVL